MHRGNNDTQSCHREARCIAMQAQVLRTSIKRRKKEKEKEREEAI